MELVDYFMEEVRRACTTPARRALLEPHLLKTFPKVYPHLNEEQIAETLERALRFPEAYFANLVCSKLGINLQTKEGLAEVMPLLSHKTENLDYAKRILSFGLLKEEVSGRFGKTDGISAFFKATLREKTSPSSNIPETLMQGILQINLQDFIEHKEAFNKLKEELIQLDVFTKYVELFGLSETLLNGQSGLLSSWSKDSLKDLKEVVDYFLFHDEKAYYGKYNSVIQGGWIHNFKSLFKVGVIDCERAEKIVSFLFEEDQYSKVFLTENVFEMFKLIKEDPGVDWSKIQISNSPLKAPHQQTFEGWNKMLFEGWNKMLSEMYFFIEGKHILLAAKEDWASPPKKPKQKI